MTPPALVELVGQFFTIEVRSGQQPDWMSSKKAATVIRARQQILIAEEQGADQSRDSVLHEVIHALLGLVDPGESEAVEERIVSALSPTLLDALRRNPSLVEYLVAS